MMKTITLKSFALGMILLSMMSCQKNYDKTYEDYDFVKLKYEDSLDYSNFKTFTLADTISFVVDTLYNGENGLPNFNIDMDELTDGEYSKSVIKSVRENLIKAGLKELDPNSGDTPDISVTVSSMTLKQVSQYTYYPTGGYYPWWGHGGYWNNYYTWGVTAYYSSNNGLLTIDMFDVLHAEPYDEGDEDEAEAKSFWHGSYEGIVGPTAESYNDRVIVGIDEIFENDNAFKFPVQYKNK